MLITLPLIATNPANTRGIKMRVCHVTGCPEGSATCRISACMRNC